MKRFIRYLYEYNGAKRIRNVGFVKVETGCEETIVQVQAKGFHNADERKLVLYLFYEKNEKIVGISQGEMELSSPSLNKHLSFAAADVKNYEEICGILIETESGRRIAATWDDQCVDVSRFDEIKICDEETPPEVCCEEEAPVEVCREEEAAVEEYCKEDCVRWKLTRISRQDISKLPHCEWKLANNQFLMHGYNNFQHLLLIDGGNYLKLGVPGIYHIKEADCAEKFGFDEFISAEELGMDSDEELFGYWCRPVRRRRNQ